MSIIRRKKVRAKQRQASGAFINQRKWMRALKKWARAGFPLPKDPA